VWENVRDWEHLPWLHRTSFASIACEEAAAWGWRARVGLHGGAAIDLELRIEPDAPRYVARTLAGPGAGAEIWTTLEGVGGGATDVAVEFHLPGIAAAQAGAIGAAYTKLYTQLWDEDEAMMLRRTAELARPRAPLRSERRALGPIAPLRARLPLCVDHAGDAWRLVEIDGAIRAHATRCPHWLGPLDAAPVENGAVTCPWHGWRFDVASGRACDGRRARLAEPPRIEVDPDGIAWLITGSR
jgi:nitrite reductase/ring-hydroxylating ferredoxin subunit